MPELEQRIEVLEKEKSNLCYKAQEAQNHLLKWEKTLNQIREEVGLEPIADTRLSELITKV